MIIIGLGNPGPEYEMTRHNAGFLALDIIASKFELDWGNSTKFKAHIASDRLSSETSKDIKVLLVKPQTFMNLSGIPASLIKSFYKENIEDIVVIHDDIDLTLGQIRYKKGGSAAGHNGLKSLDQHIGNNYHRIRIGVGRPQIREDVADYVLSNFAPSEQDILNSTLEYIQNSTFQLLEKNFSAIVLKSGKSTQVSE